MFRGISVVALDIKGRLAMPTRYRDVLIQQYDGALVVTIDTDETCLLLYPKLAWQEIEDKLQALPSFNPVARRVQRLLIGHATDVTLDGSGRLLFPPELRDYAQLNKRAVMIGQGNKFEIWDEGRWQSRRDTWLQASPHGEALPDEMKNISL